MGKMKYADFIAKYPNSYSALLILTPASAKITTVAAMRSKVVTDHVRGNWASISDTEMEKLAAFASGRKPNPIKKGSARSINLIVSDFADFDNLRVNLSGAKHWNSPVVEGTLDAISAQF